jgi:hypothetical protein
VSTPYRPDTALNAICPYFTMFPLEFPLGILKRRARKGQRILDPFCGRGTTNYAARLQGLDSLGVDSSPVAAAITAAKLVAPPPGDIVAEATRILTGPSARHIPQGEFWKWGFHPITLAAVCKMREALVADCTTSPRIALRGILLGALHGPRQKTFPSYFSNQCPRTYAPKPAYATRFWADRSLVAEPVDVLAVIKRRAERCYGTWSEPIGCARLGDSRFPETIRPQGPAAPFDWVITSPPYYGMRTYLPDQWLRLWLLGGPDSVDYRSYGQLRHQSAEDFAAELRQVWRNAASVATDDARLVVRFGGISDRDAEPRDIFAESLCESGWRRTATRAAGTATSGRRQADAFLTNRSKPIEEYDFWTERN